MKKLTKKTRVKKQRRSPAVSDWLVFPKRSDVRFDEEQKRSLSGRIAIIVILFLLSISSLLCALNLYQSCRETFPNAIVLRSSYGLGDTFDKPAYDFCSRVSQSQALVTSENPMLYDMVNLYYTEDNYDDYVSFDMAAGTYFNLKPYAQQNRVAVISDEMAVRHFKTDQAVGQIICINGTEYMVCGVYHHKEGLLADFSQNGNDDVYIPYKSVENPEQLPVHYILVSTEITEFTEAVISAVASRTQISLYSEHTTGYQDLLEVMQFLCRLTMLFMGLTVIALLCWRIEISGTVAYRYFKTEDEKNKGSWYAIKTVVLLLLAVLIFLLVKFELKLPQSVLPESNFFDFEHYFEEILSAVQSLHAVQLYDFHWNYCFGAMFAYGGMLFAAAVLFLFFVLRLTSLLKWVRRVNEEDF